MKHADSVLAFRKASIAKRALFALAVPAPVVPNGVPYARLPNAVPAAPNAERAQLPIRRIPAVSNGAPAVPT